MDQNKFFYFHLFNHIFMSCYWVFILIFLCLCLYLYIALVIFLCHWISIFAQILCFHDAEPWWLSFTTIQKSGKCKKTLGTTLCFWFLPRTVNKSFYDFMYLPKLPSKNHFSFYEWLNRWFSQKVVMTLELSRCWHMRYLFKSIFFIFPTVVMSYFRF